MRCRRRWAGQTHLRAAGGVVESGLQQVLWLQGRLLRPGCPCFWLCSHVLVEPPRAFKETDHHVAKDG